MAWGLRGRKRAKSDGDENAPGRGQRLAQIKQAFTVTRENDPRLIPYLVVSFVVPLAVLLGLGLVLGHAVLLGILGFLAGLLAAVTVFGRRATNAVYAQVEGKPGAALSVLQSLRGDWRVTPLVVFTRDQDMVHRALGRPGVLLVGEGNPVRVRQLLLQEKRKVTRVVADTPVYDVLVGEGAGEVSLRRLQSHIAKLPRNVKPAALRELENRMRALGGTAMPVPKGPMPRSVKAARGKQR